MSTVCCYVILPVADATQAMVEVCIQTSLATLRKSIDGTQCVLKYHLPQPASLSALTELTHAQTLTEMAKIAWDDGT